MPCPTARRLSLPQGVWACLAAFALSFSTVASAAAAEPLPEPTIVDVPEAGGPATVPGDAPPTDKRTPLPVYRPKLRKTLAPKAEIPAPAAPKVAVAKVAPRKRIPAPPRRPVQQQIELTAGFVTLPDSWLGLLDSAIPSSETGRRDRHPALTAATIDVSWWKPLTTHTFFAARFGVAIPTTPDGNWYSSKNELQPLYTQLQLAVLEVAAEYGVHWPVHPRLALTARAGLGLAILAGSAKQTETLPGCTPAQAATCPHWRVVGQEDAPVPPVLPTVRLTAGALVKLHDDWQLSLDGGVRSGLYGGFGLLRRF